MAACSREDILGAGAASTDHQVIRLPELFESGALDCQLFGLCDLDDEGTVTYSTVR